MVNKTQQGGKPTIEQDTHDKNVGQREDDKTSEKEGAKPGGKDRTSQQGQKPGIDDNRGGNYGQREGSTVAEDNDVE